MGQILHKLTHLSTFYPKWANYVSSINYQHNQLLISKSYSFSHFLALNSSYQKPQTRYSSKLLISTFFTSSIMIQHVQFNDVHFLIMYMLPINLRKPTATSLLYKQTKKAQTKSFTYHYRTHLSTCKHICTSANTIILSCVTIKMQVKINLYYDNMAKNLFVDLKLWIAK